MLLQTLSIPSSKITMHFLVEFSSHNLTVTSSAISVQYLIILLSTVVSSSVRMKGKAYSMIAQYIRIKPCELQLYILLTRRVYYKSVVDQLSITIFKIPFSLWSGYISLIDQSLISTFIIGLISALFKL